MLTKRERQILGWIKANPSISQREIAERAQITRSSVAVHISNLIKKGAILGREYIISDRPYVVVIGGANMDVAGKPDVTLIPHDSNPGTVRMSPGGAGRNVAHNLALLGCDVKLISAFGDDARGRDLAESCRRAGIDVNDSVTMPGATTSSYVFIMNEQGEMQLAVADMKIFDRLVPATLERRLDVIDRAAICVVDTNIPKESLSYLAKKVTVPLFCDPVSTAKAVKLKGILGRIDTLKPNLLEAEALSGVPITDDDSLRLAAKTLLRTGLKRVFISLGDGGIYCADHETELKLPTIAHNVVNATGTGDTMMAAIAWASLMGGGLTEAGAAGLAAAAVCAESPETISPYLTTEGIRRRIDAAGLSNVEK
jgi:pseudouridine kinase